MAFARMIESRPSDLGSSVVVVIDEKTSNFVLIREITKPPPIFWKFPGGKIKREDFSKDPKNSDLAAKMAAIREVKEETGLEVKVVPVGKIRKREHYLYIFAGLAKIDDRTELRSENPAEEVRIFSLEEIRNCGEFLPQHKPILDSAIKKIKEG